MRWSQRVYYIYVLLCPDTGKVRYVGRTINPAHRRMAHLSASGSTPVDRWKRKVFEAGKKPVFRVIETGNRGNKFDKWREHWWIRYFRHQGQPILNVVTLSHKTARYRKF